MYSGHIVSFQNMEMRILFQGDSSYYYWEIGGNLQPTIAKLYKIISLEGECVLDKNYKTRQ